MNLYIDCGSEKQIARGRDILGVIWYMLKEVMSL